MKRSLYSTDKTLHTVFYTHTHLYLSGRSGVDEEGLLSFFVIYPNTSTTIWGNV